MSLVFAQSVKGVVRFNLAEVDGESDFVFTANSGVELCLEMVPAGAKAEALPLARALITKAEYFIVLQSIYFLCNAPP